MFLHYTDGAHLLTERRVNKLKKLVKWFSIFAVIGTAIGLAVAYFCKNSSDIPEENDPAETEDDDFDLDCRSSTCIRQRICIFKKTDDDTDGESESLEENSTEIFRVFTILYTTKTRRNIKFRRVFLSQKQNLFKLICQFPSLFHASSSRRAACKIFSSLIFAYPNRITDSFCSLSFSPT